MTPAEIAKIRTRAMTRNSRELAEKLVAKYTVRLVILNAKEKLSNEEHREREDLRSIVTIIA